MIGLIRWLRASRFERAYIRLYNGEIAVEQFINTCGIEGKKKALDTLCKYREKVLSGEIPDPRDKYHKWR